MIEYARNNPGANILYVTTFFDDFFQSAVNLVGRDNVKSHTTYIVLFGNVTVHHASNRKSSIERVSHGTGYNLIVGENIESWESGSFKCLCQILGGRFIFSTSPSFIYRENRRDICACLASDRTEVSFAAVKDNPNIPDEVRQRLLNEYY